MISILILTYDEEANIADCLACVNFSDDVVVLDSGSCDQTVEIAQKAGATVKIRSFDNYAAQRNYGLSLDFKYDWILMLDADERVPMCLVDELQRVTSTVDNAVTLYRLRRKDMFMGKWLRRSSGYPTWFGRLFRKGHVRVEREINEEYYTDGEVGLLDGHLIHYPFNKGMSYWIERHNRYSSMETVRLVVEKNETIAWSYFLSRDPMLRRKVFKQMAYRLPFRPTLSFWYLFLFRGGFLDGRPGYHYSRMRAMYEYMIHLKMLQNNHASNNETTS